MKDSRSTTQGNIIPKTKTEIKVEFNPLKDKIDYNKEYFTEIDRWYSDKNPVAPDYGVKKHLSLNEVNELQNSLEGVYKKNTTPALLKGIFKCGTGGRFCVEGSPFLVFDIDVKDTIKDGKIIKENIHLFDKKLNSDVFDYLEKISALVARSHSGNGIFGILYVPIFANFNFETKDEHKLVGDQILAELSRKIKNEIGVSVKFDSSQSTFRHIRNTYVQKTKRKLNTNPIQVDVEVSYKEMHTVSGIPQYTYSNYTDYKGSIRYKFNEDHDIEDTLIECGFEKLGDKRYLHPLTSSKSTGQVNYDTNTFYSHSESYGVRLLTPFDLKAESLSLSNREFSELLKKEGYTHDEIEKSVVDSAIERLNYEKLGTQDIFEICSPLLSLSINDKYNLIDKLDVDQLTRSCVHEYLKIPELPIIYNYELKTPKYLSDCEHDLIPILDQNKKIIIFSGTGSGKTTFFVNRYKNFADKKTIILVPLQAIALQIEKDHGISCLLGDSSPDTHSRAKKTNMFVATYEQGVKYISEGYFDYIIVDEFHNLLTANSYKQEVLTKLTYKLEHSGSRLIGLTGTPTNIMKRMGYKLVRVTTEQDDNMIVEERFTNHKGHFTIIDFILKHRGKCLIRHNSTKDLESVKAELVELHGYKADEIFILYSSESMKKSKDFKTLVNTGIFPEKTKIALVTAIIDEGISIYQKDFDQIGVIEANDYSLRPEPVKQFLARVRDPEARTKYYLYRKYKLKTEYHYHNEEEYFVNALETLKEGGNNMIDYSTYMDIFNNDEFYYPGSGEINIANLAFHASQTTFNGYTSYMFDKYLDNYNITIVRDENYKQKVLDPTFKKLWDKDANQAIRDIWVNQRDSVYTILRFESQDPQLKLDLEGEGANYNEEFFDIIRFNIKAFEKYTRLLFRFVKRGVDPDKYMIGNKAMKSIQSLNNQLFLIESIGAINNPISEADKKNGANLSSFVNTLLDKGTFTQKDINEELDKYGIIKKPSYQVIKMLLEEFAVITYNKQKKIYRVKYRK